MNASQPQAFRLSYELDGQSVSVEFHQPRVLIGRSTDCDLVLGLSGASRNHSAIERDEQGWTIWDLDSRHGTFVNQQRVVSRRLRDGDQINLGPTALVPVTITFHLTPPSSTAGDRVVFDDRPADANISMSIDVSEFADSMGGILHRARRVGAAGESAGRPQPPDELPVTSAMPGPPTDRPDVPIIGLFRQVGEVLLTSEDLDDMLGKVVDLALDSLPAQRGFICLCDPQAETITPKAARVKGLSGGGAITVSRSIAREAIRVRQALLVTNAPADPRFTEAASVQKMGIWAAMCAPLYREGQVEGLIYVDTHRPGDRFVAQDLELVTALALLTAVGIEQVRLRDDVERERAIRARLARYSSPRVVDQIVAAAGGRAGEMLAEQREVTVLFADLSGFTPMAEGMEPAQVIQVLNQVFEQLTRAVFQYDGTLDKYMGDALMAIFGAPLPQADHAERAIRVALLMQRLLAEGNRVRSGEPLQMRIGINSGAAVVGDIGSPIRKDYTVIGDTVNVASRLEASVARPGQVVIGPATYELVQGRFPCRPLPEIQLKGRQHPVRPYLVVGPESAGTTDSYGKKA